MYRYSVREMSASDNPAGEGPLVKRFETWGEAKAYSEALYNEDGLETYISVKR